LHNYTLRHQPASSIEVEQVVAECQGQHQDGIEAPRGRGTQLGRLYRERLAEYFYTEGQVPFQWQQAFRTQ